VTKHLRFFATCPKGIEDLLTNECEQLNLHNISISHGGVFFEGTLEDAYRMCLWSRVASRVLFQLSTFTVNSYDELYASVQTIDWSLHLNDTGSFAIDCNSANTEIDNSHFATLRIKDAIVDQFVNNSGTRPDVAREQPDIRINAYIGRQETILYLDLSGEPLHRRGYRQQTGDAPLRETLAAAILLRCKWPKFASEGKPLFDPMCGTGTLLIEAAYMAANIAPGILRRYFGFLGWKQHQPELWEHLYEQAKAAAIPLHSLPDISGADVSTKALSIAEKNLSAAGLQDQIQLFQMDITKAVPELPANKGLVITNPPYGKRLGDTQQLKNLYYRLGLVLKKHFSGWNASIFTAEQDLAKNTGLRAHHKNTLYNGAIKCTLYHYTIRDKEQISNHIDISENKTWHKNADEFANRLQKNIKHYAKWAKKNNISCYRVYDADIPQYSVAIDLYEKHVHIQEYQAPDSVDTVKAAQRLNDIIEIVSELMSVNQNKISVKTRKKQSGHDQYEKQNNKRQFINVEEHGLKFIVNLHDYLDTGLFLDHRITRRIIFNHAKDRSFLNLFAYTGVVSVYAAAGGAISTTTVDMSNTYLDWAKNNMRLNKFKDNNHKFIRADCMQWLRAENIQGNIYQLIFLDPPTFSNSKKMDSIFDIQRDHVELIKSAMRLLSGDGLMIFSCNSKRFKFDNEKLADYVIKDITALTTSDDFKRKPAHKCWCLSNQAFAENLRTN